MRAKVKSGICGFVAAIDAKSEDMQHVTIALDSDCPNVQRLQGLLGTIDAFSELGTKFDGEIHSASKAAKLCNAGCPIPAALHKVTQVAAGLALPGDASIEFEK